MVFHTTKFNIVNDDRVATVLFYEVFGEGTHEIKVCFCGNPASPASMIVPLLGGRRQIKINVMKLAEVVWQHLAFQHYDGNEETIREEAEGIQTHIMVEATAYLRAVSGIESAYGKKN